MTRHNSNGAKFIIRKMNALNFKVISFLFFYLKTVGTFITSVVQMSKKTFQLMI